jgi:hypothetical protein
MRIFLSYHTRDYDLALALEAGLRARRPDMAVYFAPRALAAGAYWLPKLAEEIGRCDALILLVGVHVGPWQELEYFEALNLSKRASSHGRPRILPLITTNQAPGLPFLALLHQIWTPKPGSPEGLDAVLAGLDDAPTSDHTPPWRRFQPFKGLASLTEQEAAFFVGREEETAHILDALATAPDRIAALIGASGVGKSSLARAGALSRLQSQIAPRPDQPWPAALADSRRTLTLMVRPGDEPLRELALACAKLYAGRSFEIDAETAGWSARFARGGRFRDLLRTTREQIAERLRIDPPRRFLLYVDQAEELYTRAVPETGRAFSRLLAEAAGLEDVAVLLSLRSDHYASFQADADLFEHAERLDVRPLGREVMTEVIRQPALTLGARFEADDMAERIAETAANAPGALPLLSDYMHEMWLAMQARDDGVLRWSDTPGLAGVSAPLIRRAEAFIARPQTDAVAVRRLFTLRLAQVPAAGEPMRRIARRSECSVAEWAAAETLAGGAWRLLITSTRADTGEACAEVAHEQLLRSWPRLAVWLEDEREFLAWKGEVELATARHAAIPADERSDALLMGRALAVAKGWLPRRGGDLAPEVIAFVEASAAREAATERERAETEQRLLAAEVAAERSAREALEAQGAAAKARLSRMRTRIAAALAILALAAGSGTLVTILDKRQQAVRTDYEAARRSADTAILSFFDSRVPRVEGATVDADRNNAVISDREAELARADEKRATQPSGRQILVASEQWLSDIMTAQRNLGALSDARTTALRRVDLARNADRAGSDVVTALVLGNSLLALADIDLAKGAAVEAGDELRDALAAFQSLPDTEATKTLRLAQVHQRQAFRAAASERWDEALKEHVASRALLETAASAAPADLNIRGDLAAEWANSASVAFQGGMDEAASQAARRAVELRRVILSRFPHDVPGRLGLARALLLVALIAPLDSPESQQAAKEGRALTAAVIDDIRMQQRTDSGLKAAEELLQSYDRANSPSRAVPPGPTSP